MNDRMSEIKDRLAKVDACRVKHYICAGCDGDIETADLQWLIDEVERKDAEIKKLLNEIGKHYCSNCGREGHDMCNRVNLMEAFD